MNPSNVDLIDARLTKLTKLWADLEFEISCRYLPRYVVVPVTFPGEEQPTGFLGLCRFHDKWRICYAPADGVNKKVTTTWWKPMGEVPQEIRIAVTSTTAPVDLINVLIKTESEYLPRLDNAIAVLETLVDGLDERDA